MVRGASDRLPVDLGGLRVAISAGARGIGKVLAGGSAAAGAQVFICDVEEAALAASGHRGVRADVGVVAEVEAFMDAALGALGGLDVLVNNAGIAGPTAAVEEVAPEDLDATLRIDLASQFHCARRAIPPLRAAGGGSLINLSSAGGRLGHRPPAPSPRAK